MSSTNQKKLQASMTVIPLETYTIHIEPNGSRYARHPAQVSMGVVPSKGTLVWELIDKILELQQKVQP